MVLSLLILLILKLFNVELESPGFTLLIVEELKSVVHFWLVIIGSLIKIQNVSVVSL
jgi:hypothetical protein